MPEKDQFKGESAEAFDTWNAFFVNGICSESKHVYSLIKGRLKVRNQKLAEESEDEDEEPTVKSEDNKHGSGKDKAIPRRTIQRQALPQQGVTIEEYNEANLKLWGLMYRYVIKECYQYWQDAEEENGIMAYTMLKSKFLRTSSLAKEELVGSFHDCVQMEGERLLDYFTRLTKIRNRLISTKKRANDETLDEDCRIILYRGVSKKYKAYVDILRAKEGVTFAVAKDSLYNYGLANKMEKVGLERSKAIGGSKKYNMSFVAEDIADNTKSYKSKKWNQKAGKETRKCYKCGKKGHLKADCRTKPSNYVRCTNCNRVGHVVEDCRMQKTENSNQVTERSGCCNNQASVEFGYLAHHVSQVTEGSEEDWLIYRLLCTIMTVLILALGFSQKVMNGFYKLMATRKGNTKDSKKMFSMVMLPAEDGQTKAGRSRVKPPQSWTWIQFWSRQLWSRKVWKNVFWKFHRKRSRKSRFARYYQKKSRNTALAVRDRNTAKNKRFEKSRLTVWVLDSGCTSHFYTGPTKYLENYTRIKTNTEKVACADGSEKIITGFGKFGVLDEVKHVPSFNSNLLSVSKLVKSGWSIKFTSECCTLINKSRGVFKARKNGELYEVVQIDGKFVTDSRNYKSQVCNSALDMHTRLGHISPSLMKRMVGKLGLKGSDIDSMPTCTACKTANLRVASTKGGQTKRRPALRRLYKLHCDTAGPISPKSLKGHRYFLLAVDDFSRVFFVKPTVTARSSDWKWFLNEVQNASPGSKIKVIRTDADLEFKLRVTERMDQHAVLHELGAAHCHWTSGVVERGIQTVTAIARVMLSSASLPQAMWNYAVKYAVYVRNRVFSTSIDGVPWEKFSEEACNLHGIKLFGGKALVYVTSEERSKSRKFSPRTITGIYIGLPDMSTSQSLVYFPQFSKSKIRRRRDVVVLNEYYYKPREDGKFKPRYGPIDDPVTDDEDDLVPEVKSESLSISESEAENAVEEADAEPEAERYPSRYDEEEQQYPSRFDEDEQFLDLPSLEDVREPLDEGEVDERRVQEEAKTEVQSERRSSRLELPQALLLWYLLIGSLCLSMLCQPE